MHAPELSSHQLAAKIIEQWIGGAKPDAKQVLAEHPDWRLEKSIVVDLAFSEYYLRQRAGEQIDLEEYCNQYPDVRVSLGRLVAAQSLRDDDVPPADDIGAGAIPPTDEMAPAIIPAPSTNEIVPAIVADTDGHTTPKTPPTDAGDPQKNKPTTPFSRSGSGSSSVKLGATQWPTSGSKVGDYDLKRQMGRGAFGRVFLAFEEPTERFVVVKLSKSRCDEAKVLGKLVHKNVVSVLSAPQDQNTGLFIIAMPYHGSATLEDLIELAYPLAPTETGPKKADLILTAARRNHHLTDPRPEEFRPDQFLNRASFTDGVVWLSVRLADALQAVHDSGFVHHDLKPSNVLLGMDGQPRLLDFNLAHDVKSTKSRLGGTIPYMPPEHLQAIEKANFDSPTNATMNTQGDLFSLGVIMYELVTGVHPYGRFPKQKSVRDVAKEMLAKQRQGFKPVRARNPEVAPRLAKLIERCLATNASDRPTTAGEIAQELRKCYSLKKRAYAFATSGPGRALFTVAVMGGAGTLAYVFANAGQAAQPIDHRRAANEALTAKNYRDAIPHLTQLAKDTPNDPEVWYRLGYAKIGEGEHLSAIHDLRKCADLRPTHGPTLALLGWAEAKVGNTVEALEMLNRAIRNGYDNASVRNTLAYCYAQRRQDEIAKTELEAALRLDPNYRAAIINRGYLGFVRSTTEKRIPERVLADVDATVKLGVPDANLYLWGARVYALAALKETKPKAPLTPEATQLKERSLELLRKAVEAGASDSLWTTDSMLTTLHGKPALFAKEWVRKSTPSDPNTNWRLGDLPVDGPTL